MELFVPGFRSLLADLPFNTICVYSFSKYFGATGWRIAVNAIHENNVFDKLIATLPRKRKSELAKRYGSLTTDVEKMKFIDRMVADSRQVALKPHRRTVTSTTNANVIVCCFLIA